jgi:ketosteroid isomerase-like protein
MKPGRAGDSRISRSGRWAHRTISLFKMIAKGKGSGIELVRDDAVVADFRDGRIVRLAYYNDQSQALEAAGLSE